MGRGVFRGLTAEEAGPDPIALFGRWFEDARRARIYLYDTICLATTSADGDPRARMMLLKGFDERGFRFFTNFGSRKAGELEANARAAIVLHWSVLHRQIRVEGTVERISEEESAEYFGSRARGSQIGAWASRQSAPLQSREELEQSFRAYEAEFKGTEVPLPGFWGGFRLKPERIEFWKGRENRMHLREEYVLRESVWIERLLSP